MNLTVERSDALAASRRQLDDMLSSIRSSATSIVDTMRAEVVHNTKVLRTIATMLEDGLILLDKDSRVTIFNPSASSIFGINAADAIGKTFDQLFPTLAKQLSKQEGVRSLQTQDTSGNSHTLNMWHSSPCKTVQEFTPFGVLIARRNPADDAELARKLDEALDLYSMTMWNFPLVIFATDDTGANVRGSKEFYNVFGGKPEDKEGKGVADVLPPEYLDWYHKQDARSTLQMELRTARGMEKFTAHKSAVYSSDGTQRILGFITCLTEHTPPQSTEVAFASSFIKTLDALPTPMVMVSFREGRILIVNKAFCDKYNYDRASVTNHGVDRMLSSVCHRNIRRTFVKSLAAGMEPVGEFKIRNALGREIKLRVKAIGISPDGVTGNMPKYCLLSES